MHPGWQYKFWTDDSARQFIAKEYSWFLQTFDAYQYPIQRADALRYFAVYHYGGVYADLDLQVSEWHLCNMHAALSLSVQPVRNLEKLVTGTDVVLFETPNLGLTNMAFAAKKVSNCPSRRCMTALLCCREAGS